MKLTCVTAVFNDIKSGNRENLIRCVRSASAGDAKGEWFYVLGCDDYICHPEVMDRLIAEAGDAEILVSPVDRDSRSFVEMRICGGYCGMCRIAFRGRSCGRMSCGNSADSMSGFGFVRIGI